jgi:hypothetical protein
MEAAMARRMLSADAALMPLSQVSLTAPAVLARPLELKPQLFTELQHRWSGMNAQRADEGVRLFDWSDRSALLAEMDLINRAQAVLDEAAVKIAPCLLRIVLTVKVNLPEAKEQRAFLSEHLQLDFRRISELCIVAESYGLLDPRRREAGAREIERYGWSSALKLAHVRNATERKELWELACAGRPHAAYRDVLEQIQLYRARKLIAAPTHPELHRKEMVQRMSEAKEHVSELAALAPRLRSRMDYEHALELLERAQRELGALRRAFLDRLEAQDHAILAGHG